MYSIPGNSRKQLQFTYVTLISLIDLDAVFSAFSVASSYDLGPEPIISMTLYTLEGDSSHGGMLPAGQDNRSAVIILKVFALIVTLIFLSIFET